MHWRLTSPSAQSFFLSPLPNKPWDTWKSTCVLPRVHKLWFLVTENPAFMNFLTNQAISLVSHVSVGWTDCPGRAGPTPLCYHTTKCSPSVTVLTTSWLVVVHAPRSVCFSGLLPSIWKQGIFSSPTLVVPVSKASSVLKPCGWIGMKGGRSVNFQQGFQFHSLKV